jgi:hypothetical protein
MKSADRLGQGRAFVISQVQLAHALKLPDTVRATEHIINLWSSGDYVVANWTCPQI